MKIAYCIRKSWQIAPGGDVVQMINTKAEIEKLHNINIRIIDNIKELKFFKPDIVHIFNMQTLDESKAYLEEAKNLGAKTILSTIYWEMTHARFIDNCARLGFYLNHEGCKKFLEPYKSFEAGISLIFGKPIAVTKKYKNEMREFLRKFDWFLPNSEEEMKIVNFNFETDFINYSVIPNSVDFSKFPYYSNRLRRGYVSAARIEPIKNQLQLVDICTGHNLDLMIVGAVTPNNIGYLKAVQNCSNDAKNIKLITQNVDQRELGNIFNTHKVHILASFRESPGLSSLEALSSGMNIVVSESEYCPIDTYFKDLINKHVFICDPYSKKSIHKAMKIAHELDSPAENLLKEFNWVNTAIKTFAVYENLFSKKNLGQVE